MSEQTITRPAKGQGYMAELDQWTDANVIAPLVSEPDEPTAELTDEALDQVRVAIREKVLESYRNGCRAGAGAVRKEARQVQSRTR
jgi:hypothetical protein